RPLQGLDGPRVCAAVKRPLFRSVGADDAKLNPVGGPIDPTIGNPTVVLRHDRAKGVAACVSGLLEDSADPGRELVESQVSRLEFGVRKLSAVRRRLAGRHRGWKSDSPLLGGCSEVWGAAGATPTPRVEDGNDRENDRGQGNGAEREPVWFSPLRAPALDVLE